MSVQDFQTYLRTKVLGRQFEYHKELGSTNTKAARLLQQEAEHGLIVITDHQKQGRGTRGKSWLSRPGQNLTFSCILRLQTEPKLLPLLGLQSALSIRNAIRSVNELLDPQLKWPNDVLIGGKKCAGILVESSTSSEGSAYQSIILGIGVNVNQLEFDTELNDRATSLRLESAALWPLDLLLAEILNDLEVRIDQLVESGEHLNLKEYREHLFGMDEEVGFISSDNQSEQLSGILRGVSDDGGLLIESKHGLKSYYSGAITRLGKLLFN